uniref:SGNH hydrolase-type esterase domain-containing protein n=1 Tax=Phaeomonas parva TaxID=124430 RepID=A0A7S1XTZ8_9STRA|mmetsp:Transcript_33885/g.107057  ORF Transcript_33885/g.107057 Transcript_33885/m.107057 type:complete len:373 (+) Transcript_33885:174-1292(+)
MAPARRHLGRLKDGEASVDSSRDDAADEPRVDARRYFRQFHGHPVDQLSIIADAFRAEDRSIIWLAGDSSLDNKYWFDAVAAPVHGYERILDPPTAKQDVTHWLNQTLADRGQSSLVAMNTAVEATSLNDRACGRLLPQDQLVRDRIGKNDVLIVSVGGNDVALQPLLCTVLSALALVYCSGPQCCIENGVACPPNSGACGDLGCYACGCPNCATSCLCGWPLGFGYIVDLFKNRVGNYVRRLVAKTKPAKVLVCMIYFLDQQPTGSWADMALTALLYDSMPTRLQAGIAAAFRCATSQIKIPGTEVVPVPLFEVLNGRDTTDYCQRVEPSPSGGRKMAEALVEAVLDDESTWVGVGAEDSAPTRELMRNTS